MSKDILLNAPYKDPLQITIFGHEQIYVNNAVIFVHGFKGFKDWGFVPHTAKYLSDKGFTVITFNFSHNGINDDPFNFTDLNKFAENTFTREFDELNLVINSYLDGEFGEIKGDNKIGLIGHSRGGADALISAFANPNVDALVTWSAVADFNRFSERQLGEWKEKGYLEVLNTRTNQIMRLNYSLIEDLKENSDKHLNIRRAASELGIPWLIIHGDQDLAVDVKEAEALYGWSDKEKSKLLIINSAGHTFDIVHPFAGSNAKFDKVLDATYNFFEENLIKS